MVVHTYEECPSRVYDITQTTEAVKNGDVFVIPDERVVGFMYGADPVSVTVDCNVFHTVLPESQGQLWDMYGESLTKAARICHDNGWNFEFVPPF